MYTASVRIHISSIYYGVYQIIICRKKMKILFGFQFIGKNMFDIEFYSFDTVPVFFYIFLLLHLLWTITLFILLLFKTFTLRKCICDFLTLKAYIERPNK